MAYELLVAASDRELLAIFKDMPNQVSERYAQAMADHFCRMKETTQGYLHMVQEIFARVLRNPFADLDTNMGLELGDLIMELYRTYGLTDSQALLNYVSSWMQNLQFIGEQLEQLRIENYLARILFEPAGIDTEDMQQFVRAIFLLQWMIGAEEAGELNELTRQKINAEVAVIAEHLTVKYAAMGGIDWSGTIHRYALDPLIV